MGPRLWHVQREARSYGFWEPYRRCRSARPGAPVKSNGCSTARCGARREAARDQPAARAVDSDRAARARHDQGRSASSRTCLPPDLYARFAAQRAKYTGRSDKWERYRPIVAGALLEDAAMRKNGLSERLDVSLAVRRLARKHHVRIDEVKIPGAPDLLDALKSVGPEAESRCVAAISAPSRADCRCSRSVPMPGRAATSSACRRCRESTEASCGAAFGADVRAAGVLAQIHRRWLEALEAHLQGSAATRSRCSMWIVAGTRAGCSTRCAPTAMRSRRREITGGAARRRGPVGRFARACATRSRRPRRTPADWRPRPARR
jgi:hypothetical protein